MESSKELSWYPRKCSHWRQAVPIGDGKFVTVSALLDSKGISRDGIDLGIYLDDAWIRMLGPLTAVNFKIRGLYSAIFLPWIDRSDISLKHLRRIVNISSKFVEQGKKVDIGCLGGHGRSGTFLACLIAKVEGLNAETSIKEVRRRHCEKAIESLRQEALIYRFCHEEIPKKIKEGLNVTGSIYKKGKGIIGTDYSFIHDDD